MGKKNNLEIRLSKFCSMTRKDDSSKKKAVNVALYLPVPAKSLVKGVGTGPERGDCQDYIGQGGRQGCRLYCRDVGRQDGDTLKVEG